MHKRNRSPIDTGLQQNRKVGDIRVPKDWCDIARDPFFCSVFSDDPYSVDVNKLSEKSCKEAYEILSMAMKEFDVSKAAIHKVSIGMCQALFSSTNNQPCGSQISYSSALHYTGSSSSVRLIGH